MDNNSGAGILVADSIASSPALKLVVGAVAMDSCMRGVSLGSMLRFKYNPGAVTLTVVRMEYTLDRVWSPILCLPTEGGGVNTQ